jgi:hypothetical protein
MQEANVGDGRMIDSWPPSKKKQMAALENAISDKISKFDSSGNFALALSQMKFRELLRIYHQKSETFEQFTSLVTQCLSREKSSYDSLLERISKTEPVLNSSEADARVLCSIVTGMWEIENALNASDAYIASHKQRVLGNLSETVSDFRVHVSAAKAPWLWLSTALDEERRPEPAILADASSSAAHSPASPMPPQTQTLGATGSSSQSPEPGPEQPSKAGNQAPNVNQADPSEPVSRAERRQERLDKQAANPRANRSKNKPRRGGGRRAGEKRLQDRAPQVVNGGQVGATPRYSEKDIATSNEKIAALINSQADPAWLALALHSTGASQKLRKMLDASTSLKEFEVQAEIFIKGESDAYQRLYAAVSYTNFSSDYDIGMDDEDVLNFVISGLARGAPSLESLTLNESEMPREIEIKLKAELDYVQKKILRNEFSAIQSKRLASSPLGIDKPSWPLT